MAKHKKLAIVGYVTLFPYSSCTCRKMRMVFTRSVHGAAGTRRSTRKAGQIRTGHEQALLLRSAVQKQMPLPTAHNVPNYSPLTSAQAERCAGSVPGVSSALPGRHPPGGLRRSRWTQVGTPLRLWRDRQDLDGCFPAP